MSRPEDALERARAAAAAKRAQGAYSEDLSGSTPPAEPLTTAKLMEWALIEPDLTDVRSTRRLGAPITAFKHLLLRVLEQYHAEILAQQTRFNVGILTRLDRLQARVEELERERRG